MTVTVNVKPAMMGEENEKGTRRRGCNNNNNPVSRLFCSALPGQRLGTA
jgi:hypothetical protein